MAKMGDGSEVPVGTDFLKITWGQEDNCEKKTDAWLSSDAGEKAPECLEKLGTIFSLLDCLSSCLWGCRGNDHTIEYLVGRAYSNARASVRLLKFGFYDEALLMVRAIGENANLLSLFTASVESFDQWKLAGSVERRREYSPVKVRLRLEDLKAPIPMDHQNYQRLSELSVHVGPQTIPQSHNPFGLPTLGGYFQEAGVLVVLNELAEVMAWLTALAGLVLLRAENTKVLIIEAVKGLEESIGGIKLDQIGEFWSRLRETPEFCEHEAMLKPQQRLVRESMWQ